MAVTYQTAQWYQDSLTLTSSCQRLQTTVTAGWVKQRLLIVCIWEDYQSYGKQCELTGLPGAVPHHQICLLWTMDVREWARHLLIDQSLYSERNHFTGCDNQSYGYLIIWGFVPWGTTVWLNSSLASTGCLSAAASVCPFDHPKQWPLCDSLTAPTIKIYLYMDMVIITLHSSKLFVVKMSQMYISEWPIILC